MYSHSWQVHIKNMNDSAVSLFMHMGLTTLIFEVRNGVRVPGETKSSSSGNVKRTFPQRRLKHHFCVHPCHGFILCINILMSSSTS